MVYRVLECNVDDIGKGGVFSLIRNVIINNDDRKNIQIDIACINPFEDQGDVDELRSYGCEIYFVGAKNSKLLRYLNVIRKTKQLLCQQHYDCVHIHSDISLKVYPFLKAAKEVGVKKIIVHSHASDIDGKYRHIKSFLHHFFKKYISNNATQLVSCSHVAAHWMFEESKQSQVIIVNNGIDLDKFVYNSKIRKRVRKDLGIRDNEILIGNVGRMAYQKNHKFLVKVFTAFHNTNPNSKLLLIGEGSLKKEIQSMVIDAGIQQSVIFYGASKHVNDLYQSMDVFALPSHFEGLPISGVEAQASGLPTIFANTIDRESALTKNCVFLGIDGDDCINNWVDALNRFSTIGHSNTLEELKREGFSISHTIDQFYQLYQ